MVDVIPLRHVIPLAPPPHRHVTCPVSVLLGSHLSDLRPVLYHSVATLMTARPTPARTEPRVWT